MSARTSAWLARGAGASVVATTGAGFLAAYLSLAVLPGGLLQIAGFFVPPLTFCGLGVLVASRQPRNRIGWILLGIAGAMAANDAAISGATHAELIGSASSGWAMWLGWFENWQWISYFPGGLVLLFVLLPDGRLPGRRWRWMIWFDLVLILVLMTVTALDPAPIRLAPSLPPVRNPVGLQFLGQGHSVGGAILGLLTLLLVALTLVAPLLRLFRSRGEERQQLKWIVFASAAVICAEVAVVGIGVIVPNFDPNSMIFGLVTLSMVGIALPASFGLAILKYGLYEIDVVISRTLVYGSLAAFITAVYVGIVVGIGSLIGGGGKPNTALSILATAVVAVGFQPVRDRLQKVANRLVYGKRATPYEVLSEFSERVAGTYAGEEVLPRMAQVLADGTAAEHAVVWLRAGDRLHSAAGWPANGKGNGVVSLAITGQILPAIPDSDRAVPVRHQGELLGALSVTKRRGESFTPIEEKLLEDLAHQAGLVLKNVGLTVDLQRRLEELRASRQRVVAAQDQERRRLERNLHDGAQQNLVAIKVKLGLAEMMTAEDPQRARDLIASLKADADDALETLRDLARGIYPPLLAEQGLAAAVQAQARKAALPVTVEGDGLGRYPQELEAAVYFCVLEALQNVQKYAGANAAVVRLSEFQRHLLFEVADDGRGFDPDNVARGSGLTNMDDRIDALGGILTIASEPGRSTRVSGSLPLPIVEAA
jgi:signal transduction histidine kinase